jgi:hypothetical protein
LLWRKFRLNWPYAIGELAIVTIGILVAIAIDQWNTNRLERAEESIYLSRIIGDIGQDVELLSSRLLALKQKEASLARVAEQLASGLIADNEQFLKDVVVGANFGWNQGRANRATYDDLIGSGKFGLISDQEIRLKIAHYYKEFDEGDRRIEERETDYPDATYELVPRATTVKEDGVVWERDVQESLSPPQIEQIVQSVAGSDLASLAVAEANFGRFLRGITLNQLNLAESLQHSLGAFRETID